MKKFDVEITETLQRKVSVEAASQEDAERMVTQAWNNQDYVLDSGDFTGVDFKTVGEHELAETRTMDVLLVQPNAYPKKISVGTELEDLQAMVGGDIEVTYPFEDEVAIILNESGKINGLPLNRAIYTEDGDMQDIYAGDFLVVGLTEDDFGSLTSEQMQKFEEQFHQPQMFVRMGRSIMAIPVPDDMVKKMEEKVAKPQEKSKPAPDRDSLYGRRRRFMQEEVENRTVNLAISTTKLTFRTIVNGYNAWKRHHQSKVAQKTAQLPIGKQSIKELIGHNQGVSSIPIEKTDLKGFEQVARKYGVDYAITKDQNVMPPKYTVFFKAKDADALTSAFEEFTNRKLKTKEKPSVLEQLNKLKELVAAILPDKVRHKSQERDL